MILLTAAALHLSAKGLSQTITFNGKDVPLDEVFKAIKKQTGYTVIYNSDQFGNTPPLSVNAINTPLRDFLQTVLLKLPFEYSIENTTIFISRKKASNNKPAVVISSEQPRSLIDVTGRVLNENGESVAGANIAIKGSTISANAKNDGSFQLNGVDENATLVITGINIETFEIKVNGRTDIGVVRAKIKFTTQDEVTINAGYYTTTAKLNTGSINKITGNDIERQPVANPILALQGLAPGLLIRERNGLPGAMVDVQIRGQNSLLQGNQPLYIIDGVPYGLGGLYGSSSITSITTQGITSPFINLNAADIKSIEVLKDADATAVYGSRGANGVILITTKRAKGNGLNFSANVSRGQARASRLLHFMNTEQYLEMRREAFNNDGRAINLINAPDLLIWDTIRYTDWQKKFQGGTAIQNDIQLGLDGGNVQTSFRLNAGYHDETTVLPGDFSNKRISVSLGVSHKSVNQKFNTTITTYYNSDNLGLPQFDIGSLLYLLPPNHPDLLDSSGKLIWKYGAYNISINPFSYLFQKRKGAFENLVSNATFSYMIWPGLTAKLSMGYNRIQSDEITTHPISSQNPAANPYNYSDFSTTLSKNWISEPQLEFSRKIGNGRITALVGASWQEVITTVSRIQAGYYPTEDLMETIAAAGSILLSGADDTKYRYQAAFGRINYNWKDKYLLNITGRRDGSSRFGPGKQYANFMAAGSAWIFSEEKFINKALPWVNLGKLRFSYGITGNDQIGNYSYLNTWDLSARSYQGVVGVVPVTPFNPDYAWEEVRKLELGLDLNILSNRIQLTVDYFNNLSRKQLISYTLPQQTGFSFVKKNIDARIQNSGVEAVINVAILRNKKYSWNTSINFTRAINKLLAFPDLENSTYRDNYVIGKSLSIFKLYDYQGVDPQTGVITYNGTNSLTDRTVLLNPDPAFYGGIKSVFQYKNFSFTVLFNYAKQKGPNYLQTAPTPGGMYNQPVQVLERWQKAGDIAKFQKYTTTSSAAGMAWSSYFSKSSGSYSDATYLRLNNASFSYAFNQKWLNNIKVKEITLFVQGQNLFIISKYIGDPEVKSAIATPTLKRFVSGIRVNL
ncbi:hypothetical protein A3860_05260 [Niastella vici]|uniref:TonB-dependent receptor plug domain-containing protein n=2 Tax=Niastella vici TaxID=1703345 RepID=A0A1V9FS25_9BACT|nr:hypothetical protein A3860_05260 [Niastella vici]